MSPEIVRLEARPGEPAQLFTVNRGDPIGTIAMPSRDAINAATVASLLGIDMRFATKREGWVDILLLRGNVLTWQRNELIERMRGDWILFIDDDMVFESSAVGRLIELREEHDLDMVGGLCFRRTAPFQPTLYMRERPGDGAYNFLERWDEDEIVEVDATGMAFMLIHKRVFEMMAGGPMPSYEERRAMGGGPSNFFRWSGQLGEDLRFCQDAKEAGARIWVATGIEVGHMAEVEIRHGDFLAALATRDPAIVVERKRINDQMGFPTVTPAEARERLGWQ